MEAPLSREVTEAFYGGTLDLRDRPKAPRPGWDAMPECVAAAALRRAGATDADVRVFLTLVASLDRARDADRLWDAGARTFRSDRWVFSPAEIVRRPQLDLLDALRRHGVSQRHTVDAAVWRVIAESLSRRDVAPLVHRAVFDGIGDVNELLAAVHGTTPGRSTLFPMLQGPKIARMWVRMLAAPGGAQITGFETLEVAVDVQVQKVSEYLALTDTWGQPVESVRQTIHDAWTAQIRQHGAAGPAPIGGTGASLDPALWFFGKWGCTFCELKRRRLPIHAVCGGCRFDDLHAAAQGS
jgi:hypothetical protein